MSGSQPLLQRPRAFIKYYIGTKLVQISYYSMFLQVPSGIQTADLSKCLLEFDTPSNRLSHHGWFLIIFYYYSKYGSFCSIFVEDAPRTLKDWETLV